MSEAYWVEGGAVTVDALLNKVGLKPPALGELHHLSSPASPPLLGLVAAQFRWDATSPLDHAILRAVTAALQNGSQDTIALQSGSAVALLCSPSAVGRFNLIPRARLTLSFAAAPSALEIWLESFKKTCASVDASLDGLGWIAPLSPLPDGFEFILPEIKILPPAEDLILALAALITALETGNGSGLLVSAPSGGPWIVTLVEKV